MSFRIVTLYFVWLLPAHTEDEHWDARHLSRNDIHPKVLRSTKINESWLHVKLTNKSNESSGLFFGRLRNDTKCNLCARIISENKRCINWESWNEGGGGAVISELLNDVINDGPFCVLHQNPLSKITAPQINLFDLMDDFSSEPRFFFASMLIIWFNGRWFSASFQVSYENSIHYFKWIWFVIEGSIESFLKCNWLKSFRNKNAFNTKTSVSPISFLWSIYRSI